MAGEQVGHLQKRTGPVSGYLLSELCGPAGLICYSAKTRNAMLLMELIKGLDMAKGNL